MGLKIFFENNKPLYFSIFNFIAYQKLCAVYYVQVSSIGVLFSRYCEGMAMVCGVVLEYSIAYTISL